MKILPRSLPFEKFFGNCVNGFYGRFVIRYHLRIILAENPFAAGVFGVTVEIFFVGFRAKHLREPAAENVLQIFAALRISERARRQINAFVIKFVAHFEELVRGFGQYVILAERGL